MPNTLGVQVDGGEVVGLLSIGDVVKVKSKQQGFDIQFLPTTSPHADSVRELWGWW
jgi:hypothetical protein